MANFTQQDTPIPPSEAIGLASWAQEGGWPIHFLAETRKIPLLLPDVVVSAWSSVSGGSHSSSLLGIKDYSPKCIAPSSQPTCFLA